MILSHTRKISISGALIAMGVLLPQLFHIFGATAGATFLPMHIPVLLAGILLGAPYGMLVGAVSPTISFLFVGMPSALKLPFMLVELITYGAASGLLQKYVQKTYVSLVGAMVAGRLAYFLSLLFAVNVLKIAITGGYAILPVIITGIPGILLQLIIIPPVAEAVRRFYPKNGR